MDYVDMIKKAQSRGLANEGKMWESVEVISKEMHMLEEAHPELYWKIMRKQHGILYNRHYDQDFADWDISQMYYTNRNGEKRTGAHWTKQQILDATNTIQFPQGVTDCDKYVAYNATYADLCREFSDEDLLKIAYLFWFKDEDWSEQGSGTKIWDYMCCHAKVNE